MRAWSCVTSYYSPLRWAWCYAAPCSHLKRSLFVYCLHIKGELHPKPKLSMFLCTISKIINTFMKNKIYTSWSKLSEKLKNGNDWSCKITFWSITTCLVNLNGILNFSDNLLHNSGVEFRRATRVHLDSPGWGLQVLWILLYSVCVKHLTVYESLIGLSLIHLRESLREWTLGFWPKF